jgi:hypothetical protein
MHTYACFITDDRYTVPTLSFLIADNPKAAKTLARDRLMESPHHRRIEVVENGRRIYACENGGAAPAPARGSPEGLARVAGSRRRSEARAR